jgi:hypothetical protein
VLRTRILRLAAGVLTLCCAAKAAATGPQPAIPALLNLFDKYPIVALGEYHWVRSAGNFYISLVRTPGFADHVNTIVLECGNSLYQPILDRYINGEDVPFEQLSQVWRNTTKVFGWESPIYANLLAAVREVNLGLPPNARIRVLAADSPIDWSNVHTRAEWEAAGPGSNEHFASVIEHEVLAKQRKALVIAGVNHITRGGDWHGNPDLTTILEKHAKHSVYVILLWGLNPKVDPAIASGPVPALISLRGTPLGDSNYYGRHGDEAADAYLYLGLSFDTVWPDWNALQNDKDYWSELQRRHLIEFGCALNLETWKHLAKPCP